jgi:hypothetical protein
MYITKEFLFREKSFSTLFKNISVMRYIQSLKFNVAEHSSNVDPSLRSMSFSAWQKQYPEPIRRFILTAPQFFTFKELDKLSAETGLMILSVFYTTKAFYYFGRAPKAYAEAFLKAYKRFGVSVKLNTEIKSVEKISGSFHVTSAHAETEQADIVVSALPLPISGEVINKTFSMDYTWDRGLLLKGKFKFPNMKISVSAAPETNIRIIYNWGDHQILYFVDPGERTEKKYVVSGIEQQFPEVDFLYENKEWQLVHEFLTPYATPLQLGRAIPELDQGDGLYICGDFYSFPCLEAATSSAFKVADAIISKQ